MKNLFPAIALLAATSTPSSAFTVDFTALLGQIIINPASLSGETDRFDIIVPGYGSVTIFANIGDSLEVDQAFSNGSTPITALNFDHDESVTIRFNGPQAINVDVDYVGVSFGDDFDLTAIGGGSINPDYVIGFESDIAGGTGGLRSISFDSVPEPSAALLAGVSLLGLLRRRR